MNQPDFESAFARIAARQPKRIAKSRRRLKLCGCGQPVHQKGAVCRTCRPNWWMARKCIDCEKPCAYQAQRCKKCSMRHRSEKSRPCMGKYAYHSFLGDAECVRCGLGKPTEPTIDLDTARRQGARDCAKGRSIYDVPYRETAKAKAWEEGHRAQQRSTQ